MYVPESMKILSTLMVVLAEVLRIWKRRGRKLQSDFRGHGIRLAAVVG